MKTIHIALPLAVALTVSGCVMAPKGTQAERAKAEQIGKIYEKHEVPPLPGNPTWRDVLQQAFLANGELESRYFEWRAALERVTEAASYPNTNLSLGFSYMFSGGRMKAWDRTTISAQPDPMQSLSLPVKVQQKGKVALAEARSAGEKFRAAKFDLQKRVLTAYLDYALLAEKTRIQQRNLRLLQSLRDDATSRLQTGGPQQDLLKAQIQYRLAEDRLKNFQAELQQSRANLNSLIGRKVDAALSPPATLPQARAVPADDSKLIAVGVDQNPELAALAHEVQGRKDAIELARLQYLPDINPIAAITGSLSQTLGASLSIPLSIPALKAAVEENRALLNSTQALARQTKLDRAAGFIATIYAIRNSERQIALLNDRILPAAEELFTASRQSYSTANVPYSELIGSQQTLQDVRLMLAEARTEREKRLAELEQLAGVDVETLGKETPAKPQAAEVKSHE